MKPSSILLDAFLNPAKINTFTMAEWDLVIRQATSAGVLARLGHTFEQSGFVSDVPEKPLMHIKSAQIYAEKFSLMLDWERQCIDNALSAYNGTWVFLKGSAYVFSELDIGKGRVFSDIDLLVPKKEIEIVEQALIIAGWKPNSLGHYDQLYYRKWMHEIPPLQHVQRASSIDLHHNILPESNSTSPDAKKLLANIICTANKKAYVLAPEDMTLHSATHLFHEGEFDNGFRDISDLDLLLREFSTINGFWDNLINRSIDLNQEIPLCYALRYSNIFFETPIPENILKRSERINSGKLHRMTMDFLYLTALMPSHPSCKNRWTSLIAHSVLYIRSHWLRMPLYLLIPHLLHKSYIRLTGKMHQ